MSESFKIILNKPRKFKGRMLKAGTVIARGGSKSPLTGDHVRKALLAEDADFVPRSTCMVIPKEISVEVTVAEQLDADDPQKEAAEKAEAESRAADEKKAAAEKAEADKIEADAKATLEKKAAESEAAAQAKASARNKGGEKKKADEKAAEFAKAVKALAKKPKAELVKMAKKANATFSPRGNRTDIAREILEAQRA